MLSTSFADQIPEVAQARRLGHRIPDKIRHVYSHVAPEVDTRLLDALQHRWEKALAELASRSWANAVAQHRAIPAPADNSRACKNNGVTPIKETDTCD